MTWSIPEIVQYCCQSMIFSRQLRHMELALFPPLARVLWALIPLDLSHSPLSLLPAATCSVASNPQSYFPQRSKDSAMALFPWRSSARGLCDSSPLLTGPLHLLWNSQLCCRWWRVEEGQASCSPGCYWPWHWAELPAAWGNASQPVWGPHRL